MAPALGFGSSQRRQPLIGRDAELAALASQLEAAHRGIPSLTVLMGESGIGKSSVLRRFLRAAANRAAVVLATGHSGAVPLEVVDPLLRHLGIDPVVPDSLAADTVERAVSRAVSSAILHADDATLVVAIDDAHLADAATCTLLRSVVSTVLDASYLRPVRCMFLLTGQPPVADHDRPLDTLLVELGTTDDPLILTLEGLNDDDLAELMRQITGQRPSPQSARRLWADTRGNPLMVTLALGADAANPIDRPTLGACVDRRLSGLSAAFREALTVCAILDEPVDPLLLDALTNGGGLVLLDQLHAAGWLRPEADGWWFAQSEYRARVLLAASPAQRLAIHRQIADLLLATPDLDTAGDEVWLQIEHHLAHLDPTSIDAAIGLRVAERAGRAALARSAWARSADAFAPLIALAQSGVEAPELSTRLLADMSLATSLDNQPETTDVLLRAARTRADADDPLAPFLAARMVRNHLSRGDLSGADSDIDALRLHAERLDLDPAWRSSAWVTLADVGYIRRDRLDGLACARRAEELAIASNDPAALMAASYADGMQHFGSSDMRAAIDAFRAAGIAGANTDDEVLQGWWKVRLGLAQFHAGLFDDSDASLCVAIAHCARHRRTADQALAEAYRCALAVARNDVPTVSAASARARSLLARTGYRHAAVVFPQVIQLHVLRGDETAARDALAEMASAGHRIPRWLDDVGRHGWFTAPVTLDLADFTQRPSPDQLPRLAAVIDSAVAATTDLANAAHQLQLAFEAGTSWTSGWVTCIPRLLGVAAVHLGQFDDAERWLAAAAVACDVADASTERAAVEAGRTLLSAAGGTVDDLVLHTALATANDSHLAGLATIITRRASTARAAAADRQSGRVNDARHRVPPMRAMLFTDIVDSTGVNVRVGDRTFVAMLDRHNHVLRSAVEAHRGVIFHNTGDGYGAWFTHAADGAACALAMHNALAAEPGFTERLQIRVGIACGAPIAVDGDLFGIDVVRAARLCTAAQPNATCVDAATATAVRGLYELRPIEPVRLKGFPDPEQPFLLLD